MAALQVRVTVAIWDDCIMTTLAGQSIYISLSLSAFIEAYMINSVRLFLSVRPFPLCVFFSLCVLSLSVSFSLCAYFPFPCLFLSVHLVAYMGPHLLSLRDLASLDMVVGFYVSLSYRLCNL